MTKDAPTTIDAMIQAVIDAGWAYELASGDMLKADGRVLKAFHRTTVEDDEGRVSTSTEVNAHLALDRAIHGMWRLRGGR